MKDGAEYIVASHRRTGELQTLKEIYDTDMYDSRKRVTSTLRARRADTQSTLLFSVWSRTGLSTTAGFRSILIYY
jgi:hypothetical protein